MYSVMNRHSRDTCPGMQELRQKRVNERDVVSVIPKVWQGLLGIRGESYSRSKKKSI